MKPGLLVDAIIPARGGSKGIPRKNLLDICGRPMLAWTIVQAQKSGVMRDIYVSSDDAEILSVAQEWGAKTILRPPELATDTASSESALIHALDHLESSGRRGLPEAVLFLQVTSPLREPEDIANALAQFRKERADSLLSCMRVEDFFIWQRTENGCRSTNYDYRRRPRRQDIPEQFLENGSIYLFKPEILRQLSNRLGGRISIFEMPFWKSFQLDSLELKDTVEWHLRERLYRKLTKLPRAEDLDLVVYDFDGVMTDNSAYLSENGEEMVRIRRSDGFGVAMLRRAGIRQLIISAETNPVVAARAAKLQIEVLQGIEDKARALKRYCIDAGLTLHRTAYVGNDLSDIEVMESVGYSVAPADAYPLVKKIARIVTAARGGEGVVRELAALLLEGMP
jgi:YrbI family 3-deoxy-D-manno-octulosonate 8-phosphate phosphatase